jgi:hypothetical protein
MNLKEYIDQNWIRWLNQTLLQAPLGEGCFLGKTAMNLDLIDYRNLNAIAIKNRFSLASMDHLLTVLSRSPPLHETRFTEGVSSKKNKK